MQSMADESSWGCHQAFGFSRGQSMLHDEMDQPGKQWHADIVKLMHVDPKQNSNGWGGSSLKNIHT